MIVKCAYRAVSPGFVFSSVISSVTLVLVLVVLGALVLGVARPDLLVTTGFLQEENILVDFMEGVE